MTMHDFDTLSGTEKMQAVSANAVHLAEKMDGCFKISLYQIEYFYVETYFHTGQFTLTSVRAFDGTGELSDYLKGIDISEIYMNT
jgi:hypothetical protein